MGHMKKYDRCWYIKHVGYTNGLAYMTHADNQDKAFEKRQETAYSWSRNKGEGEFFDNIPRTGFVIGESQSRWSTQNKVFRVIDPLGFMVEVPTANIAAILKETVVEHGRINQECYWGRDGNNHILVPVGSEPDKELRECMAVASTAQKLVTLTPGAVIVNEQRYLDSENFRKVYLGLGKITWKAQERCAQKHRPTGWRTSYEQDPHNDPVMREAIVTDKLFVPILFWNNIPWGHSLDQAEGNYRSYSRPWHFELRGRTAKGFIVPGVKNPWELEELRDISNIKERMPERVHNQLPGSLWNKEGEYWSNTELYTTSEVVGIEWKQHN